jgi:hypothetical protein
MTLEQIVVTRETAEKLKSAGYDSETCFVWVLRGNDAMSEPERYGLTEWVQENYSNPVVLPAPTASELMEEILSAGVYHEGRHQVYHATSGRSWGEAVTAPTPAEALALLWIELNRKDKP